MPLRVQPERCCLHRRSPPLTALLRHPPMPAVLGPPVVSHSAFRPVCSRLRSYSSRSVSMGSIAAARRAGIHVASIATPTSAAGTVTKVTGSSALPP